MRIAGRFPHFIRRVEQARVMTTPGVLVGVGEPLPPNVITTAKAIAAAVSNAVSIATSAAVLALVPEDWRPWVLAICAALLVVVNVLSVYWTQPAVVQPITVGGP